MYISIATVLRTSADWTVCSGCGRARGVSAWITGSRYWGSEIMSTWPCLLTIYCGSISDNEQVRRIDIYMYIYIWDGEQIASYALYVVSYLLIIYNLMLVSRSYLYCSSLSLHLCPQILLPLSNSLVLYSLKSHSSHNRHYHHNLYMSSVTFLIIW